MSATTKSHFVAARDVLQERTEVVLPEDAARRFLDALDADAPPAPAMQELFQGEAPWAIEPQRSLWT